MQFSDLFDLGDNLKMAKNGLAEYGLIAALVLFGLGLLGYIIIKIAMPSAIITSWWRTPEQVFSLTGMKFDWHMLGLAFDITLPGNKVTVDLVNKAKMFFPSVIVEKGNSIVPIEQADHIHVAWVNKRMGVLIG